MAAVVSRTQTATLVHTMTVSLSESPSVSSTWSLSSTVTATASVTVTPTVSLSSTFTHTASSTFFLPEEDEDDDGFSVIAIIFIIIGCLLFIICCALLIKFKLGAKNRGETRMDVNLTERDLGILIEDKKGRERVRLYDKMRGRYVRGVPIKSVRPNSAASEYGITINNRIVAVDGTLIETRTQFEKLIANKDRIWLIISHSLPSDEMAAIVTAALCIAAQNTALLLPAPPPQEKYPTKHEDNTTPLVSADYNRRMNVGTMSAKDAFESLRTTTPLQHDEYAVRDDLVSEERTARDGFESMSPDRGGQGLMELDLQQKQFNNPLATLDGEVQNGYNPMMLVEYMHNSGSIGGVGGLGEPFIDSMVYCPSRGVCAVPCLKVTASLPPATRQVILTPTELRVEHNSSASVDTTVPLEHIQDVVHSDDGLIGVLVPRNSSDLCLQFTPAYARTFLVALGNAYTVRTGVSITARRFTAAQLISKPVSSLLRLEVIDF